MSMFAVLASHTVVSDALSPHAMPARRRLSAAGAGAAAAVLAGIAVASAPTSPAAITVGAILAALSPAARRRSHDQTVP